MPKGKVTFIVEGDLEMTFLKNQCGNSSIIRKVPSNGDDVSMDCLAKMVHAIVGMGPEPTCLFVILDREHRLVTSVQLEVELINRLKALKVADNCHVHFADRMIENWIISDDAVLNANQLEVNLGKDGTEGCGGKAKLKEAFKKNRLSYSERIDGTKLLSKCSAKKLATASISFRRLSDALIAENIGCHWAKS